MKALVVDAYNALGYLRWRSAITSSISDRPIVQAPGGTPMLTRAAR